jgi:hypothetical protein
MFGLMLTGGTLSGLLVMLAAALGGFLGWLVLGGGPGLPLVISGVIAAGLVPLFRLIGFREFERIGGDNGSRFLWLPVWVFGAIAVIAGVVLVQAA